MCLPPAQVDRFYTLWYALLNFANQQRQIVPDLKTGPGGRMDGHDALEIRESLWQDDSLLDVFIAQNPARLSAPDLALVESWKQRRAGTYFVFKYLKKHTIFIDDHQPAAVFAIKGLLSPLEDIFGPYLPVLTKAVLLPFGDEITCDGLFQPYRVTFGGGIRGNLKAIYDDAKERGDIITSLTEGDEDLPLEAQAAKAEAVNAKVLQAFQKYLYRSNASLKIAERDLDSVKAFAAECLAAPEPVSLREFETDALLSYLDDLPEAARKPAITGFKRFVRFMADSDRMDPETAFDLLEMLKEA